MRRPPRPDVDGASERLIILPDGEIVGEGRPELSAQKKRYVQQTQGEDRGVEDHPNE
jgi:hypothetical protein